MDQSDRLNRKQWQFLSLKLYILLQGDMNKIWGSQLYMKVSRTESNVFCHDHCGHQVLYARMP